MKPTGYFYVYTPHAGILSAISEHVSQYDISCIGSTEYNPSEFLSQLTDYQFPLIVLIGDEVDNVIAGIESLVMRASPLSEILVMAESKKTLSNCATRVKRIPLRTVLYKKNIHLSTVNTEIIQVMLSKEQTPVYQNNDKFEQGKPRDAEIQALKERNQARIKASRESMVDTSSIDLFAKDIMQNKKLDEISERLQAAPINFDVFSQLHNTVLNDHLPSTITEHEAVNLTQEITKGILTHDEGSTILREEIEGLEIKMGDLRQQLMENPNSPELLAELASVSADLKTVSAYKDVRIVSILGDTVKLMVDQMSETTIEGLSGLEKRIETLKQDSEVQRTKEGIAKLKTEKEDITQNLANYTRDIRNQFKHLNAITVGASKMLTTSRNDLVAETNERVKNKTMTSPEYSTVKKSLDLFTKELSHIEVIGNTSGQLLKELLAHTNVINKSLVQIVGVDNAIIASQDHLIKTYETQGARNVFNLQDRLAVKALSIVGRNGVGKTTTALQIYNCYKDKLSFLVLDLNLQYPSLHYYTSDKNTNDLGGFVEGEGLEIYDILRKEGNSYIVLGTVTLDLLSMKTDYDDEELEEKIISTVETLSNAVDKVIIIHPQELTSLSETLLSRSGEVVYVVDTDIHSMIYVNQLYGRQRSNPQAQSVFNYLLVNKHIPKYFLEDEEIMQMCGTDKTKHKLMKVNFYNSEPLRKFRRVADDSTLFTSKFNIWG